MGYSATRLTLYSLLSAIEADLRELINSSFQHEKEINKLLGDDLFNKGLSRLQKELGSNAYINSLSEIVCYLDYADTYQLLNANKALLPPDIASSIKDNTLLLESLVPIRNRVSHSRPLNFDDLAVTLDASHVLVAIPSIAWLNLKQVLEKLKTNPEFVLDQIIPPAPEQGTNNNLPIPDFDETGFLGRNTQVEQLLNLIKGPYPVITVVGEGGLGKTAIALKVAYELLEAEDSKFDSIVWTTAKAATITAQEIVRIEDAITCSLGMFAAITKELAGTQPVDPIDEILSYLKEFKILLILDNLETVIDNRLHSFLEKLPIGSKVLITSRIGLGEFERRLKLEPLNERESVQLLRALAKIRNLESLAKAPDDALKGYCRRMKNNPGYIKWFIATVQAGSRPEQILDQPTLFLEYCMSNVYGHLNSESKRVLKSMQCVPTLLSQAELTFLNGMETLELQAALYQLLATNMVLMQSVAAGSVSETKYNLSELAREYLVRKHPVNEKDYGDYRNKQRELQAAGDYIQAEKNRFSIYCITTRSKGDLIVARHLMDALQTNNLNDAQASVQKARSLAPHYFEVHRVDAWISAKVGNIPAAEASYNLAIELEPKSAPLRYWYAGFLMRHAKDNGRSAEQYLEATKLSPKEPQIKLELARVYMFMHKFDEADALLQTIPKTIGMTAWFKRKVYDAELQLLQRHADYSLKHHDHLKSLELLNRFTQAFKSSPVDVRDSHLVDTLQRTMMIAGRLTTIILEPSAKEQMGQIIDSLESGLKQLGAKVISGKRLKGVIDRIPEGKRFGFIQGEDGREYFFHFGSFPNINRVDLLCPGDEVTFQVGPQGADGKPPCALNCDFVMVL